jgi:hypothetical protein
MASLNANPEFAARRDAANNTNRAAKSARMVARHKDPKFAAAHSERSRARMAAMNSDPEFVANSTQRLRRLEADPIFVARRIARRRGLDIEIPQWVPRDLWTESLDVAAESGRNTPPPMCASSSGKRYHLAAEVPGRKAILQVVHLVLKSGKALSFRERAAQKGLEFHERRCGEL